MPSGWRHNDVLEAANSGLQRICQGMQARISLLASENRELRAECAALRAQQQPQEAGRMKGKDKGRSPVPPTTLELLAEGA